MEEANNCLKESYKRYYKLKESAADLQESWLMALAEIKAKEVGGDQFKHCNNLILQERKRIASRRLKRTLGKFKGNGLTQAVVTLNDSSIFEINTKEEI